MYVYVSRLYFTRVIGALNPGKKGPISKRWVIQKTGGGSVPSTRKCPRKPRPGPNPKKGEAVKHLDTRPHNISQFMISYTLNYYLLHINLLLLTFILLLVSVLNQ